MSIHQIKNLIKNNHIKQYKIDGITNLLTDEIIEFKDLYESTLTLEEIKKYLYNTASIGMLKAFLDDNAIKYSMYVGGAFRYNKNEVFNIFSKYGLEDRARKISNGYITIKEASRILGLSKRTSYRLIQGNKSCELIEYFNKFFVKEKDILSLKMVLESTISLEEISKQLNYQVSKHSILNILKRNDIKPTGIFMRVQRYSKELINNIFRLDKLKLKKLVNLREVCRLLDCGYDQVKTFIKIGKLTVLLRSGGELLFDIKEVLTLKSKLNTYLNVGEVSLLVGYGKQWVYNNCKQSDRFHKIGQTWIIDINNIDYLLNKIDSRIVLKYDSLLKFWRYDNNLFQGLFNNEKLSMIIKENGELKLSLNRMHEINKIIKKHFIPIHQIKQDVLNENSLDLLKEFILIYDNIFYIEKIEYYEYLLLNYEGLVRDKSVYFNNDKQAAKKHYIFQESNTIRKYEIMEYVENIRELKQNYYTMRECSKLLNTSEAKLIKHIKRGNLKCTKFFNNSCYISKQEIHSYINRMTKPKIEIKDSDEIIHESGEIYLSREKVCLILHIKVNAFYTLVKNENFSKRYFNKRIYISEKELNKYINNNLKDFIKNYDQFLKVSKIQKNYNIKGSTISHLIADKKLKNVIKYYGSNYIHRVELENYISFSSKLEKEYYTVKQVANALNNSVNTVLRYIKSDLFKTLISYKKKYYIRIDEVLEFKQKRDETKDLVKEFENHMEVLLKETGRERCIKIMLEYYHYRLAKLNNLYDISTLNRQALKVYIYLLENIQMSIFNISISNIKLIINTNVLGMHNNRYMITFINYVIEKYNNETKIKKKLSFKENYRNKNETPYSNENWYNLSNYLTKIDIHKEKAIYNPTYANLWLYCIFHLSNAWRASDIIRLPNLNLDVAKFDYTQILLKNLNYNQAKNLFEDIENKCKNVKISKTKANILLIMPDGLLISTMTAYVICEMHRRKYNKNNIFYHFRKGYYGSKEEFDKFFKESNFNDIFGNRRSNKTLLTNTREFFMEKYDDLSAAVSIPQNQRSHKLLDSIKGYIDTKDSSISEQIVDRGHFGWLYKYLLEIISDEDHKHISFNEETDNITSLMRILPAKNVENLSKYFLQSIKNNEIVAEKILKYNKNKLKEKIANVYLGKSPSKSSYVDCLNIMPCNAHSKDKCLSCSQSLPRVHSLISLSLYTHSIIARISNTNFDDVNLRKKYSGILIKDLRVLNEAVSEFGIEYINSIVDIQELKSRLDSISEKIII